MGFWDKMERDFMDKVSIDVLNLPVIAINSLALHKVETVGHCIDYFAYGIVPYKTGLMFLALKQMMERYVRPKLLEMGYWKYVEQELAE